MVKRRRWTARGAVASIAFDREAPLVDGKASLDLSTLRFGRFAGGTRLEPDTVV